MRIGDVVEVTNPRWEKIWRGIVCVVTDIDSYVRILPINVSLPRNLQKHLDGRAGFHPESLTILGHIDVAQEGEKQNANRR